jgi:hypothetical protein
MQTARIGGDMQLGQRAAHRLTIALQLFFAVALTMIVGLTWTPLRVRYPWLPDLSAGELLTFLAISFAIVQFIDARRQERVMTVIALSMSTRFIGPFPKNLKEIAQVVSKASRYVYAIVDFVGHGQYSAPEMYSAYFHELESALIRKVEIRIICYDSGLAEKDLLQQFPDDPEKFEGKRNQDTFRRYFEIHKGVDPPADNAGLRAILKVRQEANETQLSAKGLKLNFSSDSPTFFFWLQDDQEAVFAFKNVSQTERGLSFRTQDAHLVQQFKDIFDRRWKAPGRTSPAGGTR